jgi:hypothetical protein
MSAISGDSADDPTPAVDGNHTGKGNGVRGHSFGWQGVLGTSDEQAGVVGESRKFIGVWGESHGDGFSGVFGVSDKWAGVVGQSRSPSQPGVWGQGTKWQGVLGTSDEQAGVVGTSEKFVGVWAESRGPNQAALFATAKGSGRIAGSFDGNVTVQGNLTVSQDIVLTNADGAELFDVVDADEIEPGTVVVIDDDGTVSASRHAYDRRVVGIVSGAGHYRPGLVLDHRPDRTNRLPVAVFGKVFCRVDATDEPIAAGDLLCSSEVQGRARRAGDAGRAFGAVIGKALGSLAAGTGLIPVLVALQ